MMKRLTGKTAIVTGGASGIGAATAGAFAAEGANVVFCDLDETKGNQLATAIRNAGGEVHFVPADVSRSDSVQALVAFTAGRFGKIDILFANAGYQFVKPLAEIEEDEWDRLLAVNLKGVFLCAKYVIPNMVRAGGGSIIATGSVLSFTAAPGLAAYGATKAGIVNLIRGIATDYGQQGIRANTICPGCIDTPLADVFFDSQPDPRAAKQASACSHSLGRIGSAAEVAKAAVFLAGDESSFITGAAITVDGGLTAKL